MMYLPMGLELGMCSLRATIGLELTRRDVNAAILLSDLSLREVHYVHMLPGFVQQILFRGIGLKSSRTSFSQFIEA